MFLLLDALRMIRDIRRQGLVIDLWGALLNIPQLVGGLVFIAAIEAQLILAAEIVALAVAGQIHRRQRFSRLIGLCHLPWLVLLPWLGHRLMAHDHAPMLRLWLYYVAVTMLVSLVFDLADVWRYARGQRSFAWAK